MLKDYRCPKCGVFEVDRKLAEGELQTCPKCGEKVTRVFTAVPSVWKTDGNFGKSYDEGK